MSAQEVVKSVVSTLAHTPPETIYARLEWAEARILSELEQLDVAAKAAVALVEQRRSELAREVVALKLELVKRVGGR